MLNRTLKDGLLDLGEAWLSSPNMDLLFRFQCRDFPKVVRESTNDEDLLFNVMNYCKEYLENSSLKATDSKQFIVRVLNHIYLQYKNQFEFNLDQDIIDTHIHSNNPEPAIRELHKAIQQYTNKIEKRNQEISLDIYRCFLVLAGQKEFIFPFSYLPLDVIKFILVKLNPPSINNDIGKVFANNSFTHFKALPAIEPKREEPKQEDNYIPYCTVL
jgi:hypothetical protein